MGMVVAKVGREALEEVVHEVERADQRMSESDRILVSAERASPRRPALSRC